MGKQIHSHRVTNQAKHQLGEKMTDLILRAIERSHRARTVGRPEDIRPCPNLQAQYENIVSALNSTDDSFTNSLLQILVIELQDRQVRTTPFRFDRLPRAPDRNLQAYFMCNDCLNIVVRHDGSCPKCGERKVPLSLAVKSRLHLLADTIPMAPEEFGDSESMPPTPRPERVLPPLPDRPAVRIVRSTAPRRPGP